MRILIASVMTGILFCCCAASKSKGRQGIEGVVYRVSGNQMPSPDAPKSAPSPVKSTVFIYAITNISEVIKAGEASFYSRINSPLIKEVATEVDGSFSVDLPEGSYSIFTKKGPLFYANIFDEKNNIAPVTVEAGKMTHVDVRIDYDAVY